VLGRSSEKGNGVKPVVKWDCVCSCGNTSVVSSPSLLGATTVSCGCKKRKHGFSHKERLYVTWQNMRRRCRDPRNSRWAHYGGKGVRVCTEWEEYVVFRAWALSNGYTDELTIDRIDVDGDYCPENCRWETPKAQANNVSRNHIIRFEGRDYTMSELADHLGLTYSALQHRIERGWSVERIAEQPQRVVA
jgi:hypothetical protein